MSIHPLPGGASNRERTGARDLTLSTAVRFVPNVRHIDLDMVQVCPECRCPEVLMEASADPTRAATFVRKMSGMLGVYALRVIHQPNDLNLLGTIDIDLWKPMDGSHAEYRGKSWEFFHWLLSRIHDKHAESCRGQTRTAA